VGDVYYPPPPTYGYAVYPAFDVAEGAMFGYEMGFATDYFLAPVPVWGPVYYGYGDYWGYHGGYYPYGPYYGYNGDHYYNTGYENVYGHYGNTTYNGYHDYGYNPYTGTSGEKSTYDTYNSRTGTSSTIHSYNGSNAYTGNEAAGYNRQFHNSETGTSGDVDRNAAYNPETGNFARGGSASASNPNGSSADVQHTSTGNVYGGNGAGETTATVTNSKTGQTNTYGAAHNGNNVYVTPWDGNLRRSTDGGNHWQTILAGVTQTGTPPVAVTVHHLAVCPGNSSLLLCAGGGEVFRSTDQGNSWTSVLTFPSGLVTRVAWETVNTCYAATSTGLVFRSTQQGSASTWSQPYSDANKPPGDVITALAARFITWDVIAQSGAAQASKARGRTSASLGGIVAFPFRFDLVYIAYSYGGRVYKSTDGGAHWGNASGSGAGALPNIPISSLMIDLHLSDTVYIATDIGVFRTRDGGANWEPFSDGLPRVVVSDLALRATSNTLYCSTMGRGAYQRVLS